MWNRSEEPPRASPFATLVRTAGVETLTSTGLGDPGAALRRDGDDLLVTLRGIDGVDRAVVHLDDGRLEEIRWSDGDRLVAAASFSFGDAPVERPAHAEDGIDVEC